MSHKIWLLWKDFDYTTVITVVHGLKHIILLLKLILMVSSHWLSAYFNFHWQYRSHKRPHKNSVFISIMYCVLLTLVLKHALVVLGALCLPVGLSH